MKIEFELKIHSFIYIYIYIYKRISLIQETRNMVNGYFQNKRNAKLSAGQMMTD
jgi:hypothetical protein